MIYARARQLVSEMAALKQTCRDKAALEKALEERIERVWATTEVVGRTDAADSLNRKRIRCGFWMHGRTIL